MSKRVYPRQAWVLMPSFKPVEVKIVKPYHHRYGDDLGDFTEKGKLYSPHQMHETKEAAIKVGRARCKEMAEDIAKRMEILAKRNSALDKASEG